ncbi:MAG: type II toxin-antitoxin system VapC family toxin [Spirochaetia bacterium]|nr:type II toxin-antitoxin system VapC family toxin [Spirochaetia bacterium]MBQ3647474.1 type II toxin-antitoxin system VapC family toxin [Spirochaetia bacterium]MBQ3712956.1 type II toxin-antitoxin system VapC family toxin [Spirochaetia bacterium]MBR0317964.1 type II toxin-antitoxin system VapC family toxin [Spirochaetia bacterium]
MYLLDSNICIFMIRDKTHYLREKIKQFSPSLLHLSVVTVAELEYGAAKSQNHLREHMAVLNFVSPFDILNFTPKDAENFGLIRAYLEKKGIPIGPYDLEIAAQAMTRDLTVVTHNYDEFSRIPWIRVEDWTR